MSNSQQSCTQCSFFHFVNRCSQIISKTKLHVLFSHENEKYIQLPLFKFVERPVFKASILLSRNWSGSNLVDKADSYR